MLTTPQAPSKATKLKKVPLEVTASALLLAYARSHVISVTNNTGQVIAPLHRNTTKHTDFLYIVKSGTAR